MPLRHLLLALAVVAVWGTNFVIIKWGLAELPPFAFATLRFTFSAFPFVLIVKRPAVPLAKLALFGALLGVGQFGLMFYAMQRDIAPGLASLVVQMQVFFTIGIAMAWQRERPHPLSFAALVTALVGMGVIASNVDTQNVTVLGLVLTLAAALSWASANVVVRSAGRVDALAFMVWSSVFGAIPLLFVSLALEGPGLVATSLSHASLRAYAAVAWQAVGNTLFGYAGWNYLLARHPAATVTPAALLVPVFGMTASSWLLGESMPAWKIVAAALVLLGLTINVVATRSAASVSPPA